MCVECVCVSVSSMCVCIKRHIDVHLYCRMPPTLRDCCCHFSISQSDLLPLPVSLHPKPPPVSLGDQVRDYLSVLTPQPAPQHSTTLPGNSPEIRTCSSSTAFRYMGWF